MGVKFAPARVMPPKASTYERAYSARLVAVNKMFADHVAHESRIFLATGMGDVARYKENLSHAYAQIVGASGLGPWLDRFATGLWSANNNYVKRVTKGALQGKRVVVVRHDAHVTLVAPPSRVPAQDIESFRRSNLGLIKGASDDQIGQLADVMRSAQNTGQRFEDTIAAVQERLGVGQSRARLIARDQTNKFNGDMAAHTQTSAGIEEYTWTIVNDLAVRGRPDGLYPKSVDNHWKLRNTVQKWSSPPDVGNGRHYHPGQDIQCRCQAVPHVPFFD